MYSRPLGFDCVNLLDTYPFAANEIPLSTRPTTISPAENIQTGANNPIDGSAGPQNQATAPLCVVHQPGDRTILLAASSMYGTMKDSIPRRNAAMPVFNKRFFVIFANFHREAFFERILILCYYLPNLNFSEIP